MLKPFLLLSAAVLFVTVATPKVAFAAAPPQENHPTASHEKVKKLYAQDCALCHGDNGNGKTDMAKDMNLTLVDWTDPKALANNSDKELFDIIRKGKGEKMPAEDSSRAKDDEVWGLIAHIRAFSKNQPVAPAEPAADAPAVPAAPAPPSRR